MISYRELSAKLVFSIKTLRRLFCCLSFTFCIAASFSAAFCRADGIYTDVILPGPNNPRNSEGDLIRLDDGRFLLAYSHFTGDYESDDAPAYIAGRYYAYNEGVLTWDGNEVVLVPNTAGQNVMSVSLTRMQNNDIGMFYLYNNSLTDLRPVLRTSSDSGATWSPDRECISDDDMGYFVLNNDRVVRLDSGRLVMPVALHNRPGWPAPDWRGELMCYLSDDDGSTWQRSQDTLLGPEVGASRVWTQEPGVVQLNDDSLMMFTRTDAGVQYMSRSFDYGNTWSPLQPSNIISPRSPASIQRIPSTGELMLVWNPSTSSARTPLCVGVSNDEGLTWNKVLTLEDAADGFYCYTSIDFVDDRVLLSYMASDSSIGYNRYALKIKSIPLSMLQPPPPFQLTEKDSSAFAWKYEMNALPSDQDLDGNSVADFHLFDTTGGNASVALRPGGTILMTSLELYEGAFCFISEEAGEIWAEGFEFSEGFTIEARLKVLTQTAAQPMAVGIMGSASASSPHGFLGVGEDAQCWGNSAMPLGENDNSDGFHTFRIVQKPGEGEFYVWRDGILLAEGLPDGLSGYAINSLWLGDIGGNWSGQVEIDYLRFTEGAFAPVRLPGDANEDGVVDADDAAALATNWQKQSDAVWSDGDFNYDGRVDDIDAAILAANWQKTRSQTGLVPEPSGLVLLLLLMPMMLHYKRR